MAEEMAVANASIESKRTGRSTAKNYQPAIKNDSRKTTAMGTAEPLKDAKPERSKTGEAPLENSGGVKLPGQLCEKALDHVFEHFDEIIKGLMKGIESGNASGAKLLFDLSMRAHPQSDEAGLGPNDGLGLTDFLDPGFDMEGFIRSMNPAVGKPSQDGVEVDVAGPDTQLTIARGA